MTPEEASRASRFYLAHRVAEQEAFYDARRREYERANSQLTLLATGLLTAGAAAGALASLDVAPGTRFWAIAAAAASALATVGAGWGALMGYVQNAELFGSTGLALDTAAGPLLDHGDDPARVRAAVLRVEELLGGEIAVWAQRSGDGRAADPPAGP